ncbi:MAG: LLM class flavin-dependent oxidoreductase [Vicinamibacterales bacterium]|jgi:alkanesulfonate monooxygenase
MPGDRKQAKLILFVTANGHHLAAWRHPSVPRDAGHSFAHFKDIAQRAEAAALDAIFFADVAAFHLPRETPEAAEYGARAGHFEPITLLSALSAVTTRVGLICTASTTYNEPYHIARKFASLDHLSSGRAGWNLVTSANPNEAANFGKEHHLDHDKRYRRAGEFIDVVTGLWDSWADDAFLRDKDTGRQLDPTKLHVLNHVGSDFRVRGPLNIARSPQGYPVRVQAGSSDDGQELAARTADVVFTAQRTLQGAQAFYRSVKSRLARHGRREQDLLVLPGIVPIVGRSQAEAEAHLSELQQLIHPRAGLAFLSSLLGGVDLSKYDVDGPVPEVPLTDGSRGRQALVLDAARRDGLSLRQTYLRFAGGRGHLQVVGTAQTIADVIEEWLDHEAADGFNLMPAVLPGGLEDFAELVLPELRRRGRFRSGYEGDTLRENLGLPRP